MICQAIFLAGELLEQPNALLAREMTDGVLHFLTQEHGAGTPTTEQIAELVIKVLRELGQPLLAQAFAKTGHPGLGPVSRRQQRRPCHLTSTKHPTSLWMNAGVCLAGTTYSHEICRRPRTKGS